MRSLPSTDCERGVARQISGGRSKYEKESTPRQSCTNRVPVPLSAVAVHRLVRRSCLAAGVPFYFKQSNGLCPGSNDRLDGRRWQAVPELPLAPSGLFG